MEASAEVSPPAETASGPELLFSGIEVACFGSRETPLDVRHLMIWTARAIVQGGGVVRSGHAVGADQSFEHGAWVCGTGPLVREDRLRVFLPWRGYNSDVWTPEQATFALEDLDYPTRSSCRLVAMEHHPYWANMRQGARNLHTRNVLIALGAQAGVCYLGDGPLGGGSGQCYRMLRSWGVPVFDLRDEKTRKEVSDELIRRGFWEQDWSR